MPPSSSPRPDGRRSSAPSVLALVGLVPTVLLSAPAALAQDSWLEVEVATVGVDLNTGAPLALVHEGWHEVLPIWIGTNEAEAIIRVLRNDAFPRPLTHDLMASVLSTLEVELAEVRIHDLRDGTYIGSLHLREAGRDELREVDARPSDGLALAVRTGARIRVARHLLSGIPDVDFVSTERNRPIARMRGVTVAEPGGQDRQDWDIPEDRDGVVVLHMGVGMGTRGLETGDLITSVEGNAIEGALDFINAIRGAADDATIPIRILRNGEESEVQIPGRRSPGRVG